MKLTTDRILIVSGLGNIIIATSYCLVYFANYYTIDGIGLIDSLKHIELLQLSNSDKFDSSLTWGLAMFWGIMFLVWVTLWYQHEKERLKDFVSDEIIGLGVLPFLFALSYHFGLDYKSVFLLITTGFYALVTIVLYFQQRE